MTASSSPPGILSRLGLSRAGAILLALFAAWTTALVFYTIHVQSSECHPVLWWQQGADPKCWQVSVNPSSVKLTTGESKTISVQIEHGRLSDPSFKWNGSSDIFKLSDLNETSRSSQQTLTADLAKDTTLNIKITSQGNGKSKTYSVPVSVQPRIELATSSLPIVEGQTRSLDYEILGFGQEQGRSWFSRPKLPTVVWQSSDPEVVRVKDDRAIALKPGLAELTATLDGYENVTDRLSVSVKANPPEISGVRFPSQAIAPLYAGEERDLPQPEVACSGNCQPDDYSLSWSSSDSSIARVNRNGHLTTKKAGTVTVTATSNLDPEYADRLDVNVRSPVLTTFEFTANTFAARLPDSSPYLARRLRWNGRGNYSHGVRWQSSNPKVATIDDRGRLTLNRAGTTTLTATAIASPQPSTQTQLRVKKGGCSPAAAVAIGAVATVGSTVVGVPPPIAVGVGSAVSSGACWVIDRFQ